MSENLKTDKEMIADGWIDCGLFYQKWVCWPKDKEGSTVTVEGLACVDDEPFLRIRLGREMNSRHEWRFQIDEKTENSNRSTLYFRRLTWDIGECQDDAIVGMEFELEKILKERGLTL